MAIQVAALLRTIASLAYIIGVLVAVFAVWVQLEETTAANVERVAKERGDCGVNMYQCEKQLKTFEQCTAVDETVAADVTLCAAVDVDDALAANCVAAGTGLGTPQCAYTQAPGKAVGQALCIPIGLVRNGYYDCVGLQEACTAADETVAADVALCAAVVLGGNSLTCTQADAENWGKCTYWGVDVVSDFADEKSLEWKMLRYVAAISIIGGSLLLFSMFKLLTTTIAIYRKPKTSIGNPQGEDKYKKVGAAP